jgi:putative ABC transport system substrate-binding protein
MRRREFVVLFGGAAAVLPFAARAQQAMPVVGFLRSTTLAGSAHLVAAFRQGLKEGGFTEGQNVAVQYRWGEAQADRLPALAEDLIRRKVHVIVANSTAAYVLKAAATAIPVVFLGSGDPVKGGLVKSLNHPGGNITGVVFFSDQLGTKRLELLRQIAPKAVKVGLLNYPNNPGAREERRDVQAAAKAIGWQAVIIDVASDREIEAAFATFVKSEIGALLVGSGAFLFAKQERLVALAARHRLPTSYPLREFVNAGGLMSYGSSIADAYRQAGGYAARILKGEKPAGLPVMRSTKFEFVINLKTAKSLGLEFHPQLLATADEVIE